ncbi:MAG: LPXTG cell wall anchor domain-containing protein [Nitrospira sp.]
MLERQREEKQITDQKISLRWKVLQILGGILIALGFFIDWPPPQEPTLPDTTSFLMVVGALIWMAGLFLAIRRD